MRPLASWAVLAAALLGGAGAVGAQTLPYPPAKIAEVRETNAAGDELEYQKQWLDGDPVYWLLIGLGNDRTAFGEFANAQAWVQDNGTFWALVNADNNNPPFQDWGNGEAKTTLAYLMHKEAGAAATLRLHVTGGKLLLFDGGGGSDWLEAGVIVDVTIQPVGEMRAPENFYAALAGRGGTTQTESFDWGASGFVIPEASYTESGYGTSINEAELVIPAQTITYDVSDLCEECDFELWVELGVFAKNPGGETRAYAYFRDPLHVDDDEPDLGGASITYEGVTVLPTPEPSATACGLAGLVAIALGARADSRARDRESAGGG